MTSDLNGSAPIAPPQGINTISIDMQRLARLGPQELRKLGHAISTLSEVASAMTCQPRFMAAGDQAETAGDLMSEISDFLSTLEDAIYRAAQHAEVNTLADVQDRAWALLLREAQIAERLGDFAVIAAKAARDEMAAMQSENVGLVTQ